jgi:hypothetical protein
MGRLAVLLVAATLVGACCAYGSAGGGRVSVHIRVSTYQPSTRERRNQSFSLTCSPPSGTLPFAARICEDIAEHGRAMLRPYKARSVCLGSPFMLELTVWASTGGSETTLKGAPFCNWPGGTALGIYWAATQHDARTLDRYEPRLRCDEDRILLARPTPRASISACRRGLWTPRSERLIRIALRAPALRPTHLFPPDIGVRRCEIPAGSRGERRLHGKCGVSLKHVWAGPIVSFVEAWPNRAGGSARHIWRVSVKGDRLGRVVQTGAPAPQAAAIARLNNAVARARARLSDPAVQKKLRTMAMKASVSSLDRHPVGAWVWTASADDVRLAWGNAVGNYGPVYLLLLRGEFVSNGPGPGGPAPRGHVMILVAQASTFRVNDFGLSNRLPRTSSLGPARRLLGMWSADWAQSEAPA